MDEQAAYLTGEQLHPTAWRRVLLTSLLFYFAGLIILIRTGNPNLFPTVVLVGNFMVPVTYVVYFYERRYLSQLSLATTALAFVYGGLLGVFAASLLEPLFIRRLTFLSAFTVGAIEEFSKILGVLVIARHRRHDSEMDGLILGAAAGMGFAALESTGYAFTAFLLSRGSLSATVGVTLLRGLFAPVGHGTWTAILASVLFRESGARYLRINRKVVGAYLAVVILHGLWDGLPGLLASMVSSGSDVFIAQVAIGLTSLYILRERWREAKRLQRSLVRE
ncbi:MAG TPA: PrsW family glutamic-type intramembrane protease [bacterium]|nr:PrsW family glutamic-type intramembrane protease [bacterium]